MAKFIFKLESLLNVKLKLEDKAKTEYGKANSDLQREKDLLNQLYEQKNQTIAHFKNSLLENINPFETGIFNKFIKNIDGQIEKQNQNIENAEKIVEEKRIELVEAMKQRKIFETLKENKKEIFNKELLLNEQKVIDEIVSYKYSKG